MVHPHTRGEDFIRQGAHRSNDGSPPHTWGRHYYKRTRSGRVWFTPTHVGKTSRKKESTSGNMVHPHTRGEDNQPIRSVSASRGSPPHTWGRLKDPEKKRAIRWFTPTHVGKTHSYVFRRRDILVHPHTRGEDVATAAVTAVLDGSPPHTWGRPYRNSSGGERIRFTPTHVGKTYPMV